MERRFVEMRGLVLRLRRVLGAWPEFQVASGKWQSGRVAEWQSGRVAEGWLFRAVGEKWARHGGHALPGFGIIHPRSTICGGLMRAGCRPWSRKVFLAIVIRVGVVGPEGTFAIRWR